MMIQSITMVIFHTLNSQRVQFLLIPMLLLINLFLISFDTFCLQNLRSVAGIAPCAEMPRTTCWQLRVSITLPVHLS